MSKLGKKAWRQLEAPQGYSFIADSIEGATDDEALTILMAALPHARNVVKIMERLIDDGWKDANR